MIPIGPVKSGTELKRLASIELNPKGYIKYEIIIGNVLKIPNKGP